MQKFLLTFFCCFLSFFNYSFGQELQESIDWVNSKKMDGFDYYGITVEANKSNKFLVSNDGLRVEAENGAWVAFNWNTIIDMRISDDPDASNYVLTIISSALYENNPAYIGISFKSEDLRERFATALIHISELKGGSGLIFSDYNLSVSNAIKFLSARSIDIFTGETKFRIDYTSEYVKEYYYDSAYEKILYWKDVKEIKKDYYSDNYSYTSIKIIGSVGSKGEENIIQFYVNTIGSEDYFGAIQYLAKEGGAKLVKDDLF